MAKIRKTYRKPEIMRAKNHGAACIHCRIDERDCWKTHRRIGESLSPACVSRLNKVAELEKRIA